MSVKEVTLLRKSGRLDEALQVARADYRAEKNEWTLSSLFWVARDYCNLYIAKGDIDNAATWLDNAKKVLGQMADNEGFANKATASMEWALKALRRSALPHADTVDNASRLSKEGKAAEAYALLAEIDIEELDATLHDEYGWVVYRYLKVAYAQNDMRAVGEALNRYLSLSNTRPSLLHSLVLWSLCWFVRTHPEYHFHIFFEKWGMENLTDDDWRQTRPEGSEHTYPSLAENAIKHYCHSIEKAGGIGKAADAFGKVLERAVQTYPDNPQYQRWLAAFLFCRGDKQGAAEIYRRLLRKHTETYLWAELASIADSRELRMSALCRALSNGDNDEFVGRIRMALAQELIGLGRHGAAAYELSRVVKTYERKGWHLPPLCLQLQKTVAESGDAKGERLVYADETEAAEQFVYEGLERHYGVVAFVNEKKMVYHIATPDSTTLFQRYKKKKLAAGDFVSFRLNDDADGGRKAMVCLRKADAAEASKAFKRCVAVISGVNAVKRLYHFIANEGQATGTLRFGDKAYEAGQCLEMSYYVREGSGEQPVYVPVAIDETDETAEGCVKTVSGRLRVRYRTSTDASSKSTPPDFAFVENCYVHASMLKKHNITADCNVKAKAIRTIDGKWSVCAIL